METVRLVRYETSDQGTFGKIFLPTGESFKTGELPWEENKPQVSCIPAGSYLCKRSWSPGFKRVLYQVLSVKGRAGIRIHPANLMGKRSAGFKSQLQGCVALGNKLGTMDGQKALLLSASAVGSFERLMKGATFRLVIEEAYGNS